MNDTSAEVQVKYQSLIMSRSPSDRIAMACRMFSTARSLMIAGIQGDLDKDEVRWQLFLRLYGDEVSKSYLQKIKDSLKERH